MTVIVTEAALQNGNIDNIAGIYIENDSVVWTNNVNNPVEDNTIIENPADNADKSGDEIPVNTDDNSGDEIPVNTDDNSGDEIPVNTDDNSGDESPVSTGDNSPISLLTGMFAAALLLLITVYIYRKRRIKV